MSFKLASQLLGEIVNKQGSKKSLLKFRNGVHYFVLPLSRLTINYCDKLMDSEGIRNFLMSFDFLNFVVENPSVEFVIEPRRGRRPVLRASYLNSGPAPIGQTKRERPVSLCNLNHQSILAIFHELRNDSGQARRRFKATVHSDSPAIRPIWSPFHDNNQTNNPLHVLKQIVAEKKTVHQASLAKSIAKLPTSNSNQQTN